MAHYSWLVLLAFACATGAEAKPPALRVYAHLLEPETHPDFRRRHVQPPTWETFGHRTRFLTLRGFSIQDGMVVNYVQALDEYTVTHKLGDVIWPSYPVLFAKNLGDVIAELKRRELFLFDIWGYVPGSGPGGYWQQFTPPPGVFAMLESKLGDHWLGMDVGEQDGRYVGGYARQMDPIGGGRVAQYLNFQHHFQAMCDQLGNRMATLVSLNFGHYLIREGLFTTIGAETAQGLPNGQVYYAFIRGAGKQYGVPWFGNASVWNRWGYKDYGGEGANHGPTKGTSLNLLKRLLYSHILYNCVFVGYESGWLHGNQLTPIGRMQQAARRWVRKHGQPGTMLTPVALLMDFFSGWTFPRHLYTNNVLRVWGNLPYGPGDYLTDNALNLFYPGYQDSAFFHDERGFLTPTPYGDVVDCLLSDAPGWVLDRYPLLIVAGELRGGAEIHDKLAQYVERGGHLVLTAGNLAKFAPGFGGLSTTGGPIHVESCVVRGPAGKQCEDRDFDVLPVKYPPSARVIQRLILPAGKTSPASVQVRHGKGMITVFATPFGIATKPRNEVVQSAVERPYASPYPLLAHVRLLLSDLVGAPCPFEAPAGLSLIVCRKGRGEYTLGLCNNGLSPRPFRIVSRCGQVESVHELPLDQSEKGAVGYLPNGLEATDPGRSNDTTIAGGDVRIFRIKVDETGVEEIPRMAPPPRPKGRLLPLRNCRSIREAILVRPTFFQYLDGVTVDWRYLRERNSRTLQHEAGWIRRQGLRVLVDLTSGLNLFPDLRLVDNDPPRFAASMAVVDDILEKMTALGAKDLIVSLHRRPENNFSAKQTRTSFDATLRRLCAAAAARGVTVYLRTSPKGGDRIRAVVAMMDRVAAPNLRWAASTALLLHHRTDPMAVAKLVRGKPGLWLISVPEYDLSGQPWTMNGALAGSGRDRELAKLLAAAPGTPLLLDGVYTDRPGEYLDVREADRLVDQALSQNLSRAR